MFLNRALLASGSKSLPFYLQKGLVLETAGTKGTTLIQIPSTGSGYSSTNFPLKITSLDNVPFDYAIGAAALDNYINGGGNLNFFFNIPENYSSITCTTHNTNQITQEGTRAVLKEVKCIGYYSNSSKKLSSLFAPRKWVSMSWPGSKTIIKENIWYGPHGETYYSTGSTHYQLIDDSLDNIHWDNITWKGVTNFSGANIWRDTLSNRICLTEGENSYYLDDDTWKTMDNVFDQSTPSNFRAKSVWHRGNKTFYSYFGEDYELILDSGNERWEETMWSSGTNFDSLNGEYIWSFGGRTFYSNSSVQYELIQKGTSFFWKPITWSGSITTPSAQYIWDDGETVYYSPASSTLYYLNLNTMTWSSKSVSYSINGQYIWKDGENIYYNNSSYRYLFNKSAKTFSSVSWSGLSSFYGNDVWDDGTTTYYNNSSTRYYLPNSGTRSWTSVSWTGSLTNFYGRHVWKCGDNIYYSNGTDQYKKVAGERKWEAFTWNGISSPTKKYIWNNGDDYFYSSGSGSYKLNKTTNTWEACSFQIIESFDGSYIWDDGIENSYFSNGSIQKKINITERKLESSKMPTFLYGNKIFEGVERIRYEEDFGNYNKGDIKEIRKSLYFVKDANYGYRFNKEYQTWEEKDWINNNSLSIGFPWSSGNFIYASASESSASTSLSRLQEEIEDDSQAILEAYKAFPQSSTELLRSTNFSAPAIQLSPSNVSLNLKRFNKLSFQYNTTDLYSIKILDYSNHNNNLTSTLSTYASSTYGSGYISSSDYVPSNASLRLTITGQYDYEFFNANEGNIGTSYTSTWTGSGVTDRLISFSPSSLGSPDSSGYYTGYIYRSPYYVLSASGYSSSYVEIKVNGSKVTSFPMKVLYGDTISYTLLTANLDTNTYNYTLSGPAGDIKDTSGTKTLSFSISSNSTISFSMEEKPKIAVVMNTVNGSGANFLSATYKGNTYHSGQTFYVSLNDSFTVTKPALPSGYTSMSCKYNKYNLSTGSYTTTTLGTETSAKTYTVNVGSTAGYQLLIYGGALGITNYAGTYTTDGGVTSINWQHATYAVQADSSGSGKTYRSSNGFSSLSSPTMSPDSMTYIYLYAYLNGSEYKVGSATRNSFGTETIYSYNNDYFEIITDGPIMQVNKNYYLQIYKRSTTPQIAAGALAARVFDITF